MVTGSHNPPQYNGLKVCLGQETLHGPSIRRLREIACQPIPRLRSRKGIIEDYPIIPHYLAWMSEHFHDLTSTPSSQQKPPPAEAIKVVIDAGNGTGGLVAPSLLRSLGCRVVELYCEPDGSFPHHHPDPTLPEDLADLIARVKVEEADLGIAYDGDADRIGVVAADGEIIWGDKLMLLFARDLLSSRSISAAPPPIFIAEVKCSQVLYDEIERLGGVAIMSKTGHSPIKQLMRETGALLAGEMSGHLFFADRYFGYDDAIYASARLVEILMRGESSLAGLLEGLPPTFATPEIRLDCPDDQKKFNLMAQLGQSLSSEAHPPFPLPLRKVITIDGFRIVFDQGWALVRASNTQPALVLRVEASSPEALAEIRRWMEQIIKKVEVKVEHGSKFS
jgi:phosphomannomutase/phosphoglucomutase